MMESIVTVITEDDLIPAGEREWTETFDDLMIAEPWGMDEDAFLKMLSECSGIPNPEHPSVLASPTRNPASS